MAILLSLEGIASMGGNEDRALAYLKVDYDGTIYEWKSFVPKDTTDLTTFLTDITPRIQLEIDTKEAEWTALDPKTREVIDPITGQPTIVPILKEEIVTPDIPDYAAKRRALYPTVNEQLEALWEGKSSSSYTTVSNSIDTIRSTYDKKYLTAAELQAYKIKIYIEKIHRRLDQFAREKEPFLDMNDACSYAISNAVPLFRTRALYCADARANTWKAFSDIVQDVKNNVRTLPPTFADLVLELPVLTWP